MQTFGLPSFFTSRCFMKCVYVILVLVTLLDCRLDAAVISLDSNNIDKILAENEVVFVNFYADWCRFSQHLKPIFEDASKRFEANPPGQVAFAAVDCDRHPDIGQKYMVNKYPTLKLFRNGEMIKKEYRGQRSADALTDFVNKQTISKIVEVGSEEELIQKVDKSKPTVIGYFTDEFNVKDFNKIASMLRDDCDFFVGKGNWTIQHGNSVFFKDPKKAEEGDFEFTGDLTNFDQLKKWLSEKCVPMVREITFENAEELTEEGIPFLILFRTQGDTDSEKKYIEAVFNELSDQKSAINCLMADGKRFAHPLHHLSKSEKDLPLIAIDSFRHMYLFPEFKDLEQKGRLRQFVMDLHSGKLHREFHHGPDPTPNNQNGETQPPPSVFKQLKPSENRYSLLNKDEL